LEEVLSHLTVAYELIYVPEEIYTVLISEGDEIDRMLNGYIAYLKKSKQGAGEPGANHPAREESPPYTIESGEDFTGTEDGDSGL
jgi:hypothetical protein